MEKIDFNNILHRKEIESSIISFLANFKSSRNNLLNKRGIYLSGTPGVGKTEFITRLLKANNFDCVLYNASDVRNKTIIETITKHNMSDRNVISMFYNKTNPIVIVMDEIDGMNSGDKGGINALIKLIRPKKTKKQLTENITSNPIICIGNHETDKKIKELTKVCIPFVLEEPTNDQVKKIIHTLFPTLKRNKKHTHNAVHFIGGDLRRLQTLYDITSRNKNILPKFLSVTHPRKYYSEDAKSTTKYLFDAEVPMNLHTRVIHETDRTIIALLWHENIVRILDKLPPHVRFLQYHTYVKNICFSDFVDRITFQKQIWQLNEMSSLTKTLYNSYLFHKSMKYNSYESYEPIDEIHFTKVLTKYSTEYNHNNFIRYLSNRLQIEHCDLLHFFHTLKELDEAALVLKLESYEITKLDIIRIYKYLVKCESVFRVKSNQLQNDMSIIENVQDL